ncbi:MAG: antiterminator LoaP [Clostridia bacterium]|nr:antiterminator LoaP [Clostridia bacterium]
MNESNAENNWYAVFVVTGEEDNVKERLQYRLQDNYRILVPKRKIKERRSGKWTYIIKPLFPGYVLVNGNIDAEEFYKFKDVPGIIKLLRSGYEPLKIDEYELEFINKLICNDETIGYSNILIENGKAVVIDGPLTSMEGYILGIDKRKGRAKIRVSFLGEERVVELGINVLQPAGE